MLRSGKLSAQNQSYLQYLNDARSWSGSTPSRRLYDLRHTFASLALSAGAHVKVVSDRLGHSSAKMTLDVYAHATAPLEQDATSRIEGVLFGL